MNESQITASETKAIAPLQTDMAFMYAYGALRPRAVAFGPIEFIPSNMAEGIGAVAQLQIEIRSGQVNFKPSIRYSEWAHPIAALEEIGHFVLWSEGYPLITGMTEGADASLATAVLSMIQDPIIYSELAQHFDIPAFIESEGAELATLVTTASVPTNRLMKQRWVVNVASDILQREHFGLPVGALEKTMQRLDQKVAKEARQLASLARKVKYDTPRGQASFLKMFKQDNRFQHWQISKLDQLPDGSYKFGAASGVNFTSYDRYSIQGGKMTKENS